MLDFIINFLVGCPAGVDLALWPLLIPLLSAGVGAAGSYFGRPRESDAQKANEQAQSDYLRYQMDREKRLDPMHEALIRMAMGMMPNYSQSQYGFDQWSGLSGSPTGRRAMPRDAMDRTY